MAAGALAGSAVAQTLPTSDGPFRLPPLGYGYDALGRSSDTATMHFHHDLIFAPRPTSRPATNSYRAGANSPPHRRKGSSPISIGCPRQPRAHFRPQQSGRRLEPYILLELDDAGRLHAAERRTKRRHRQCIWRLFRNERATDQHRSRPFEFQLGMARGKRKPEDRYHHHSQSRTHRSRWVLGPSSASTCGNTRII